MSALLEIDNIGKTFGKLRALDGVSLTVRPGEDVAVVGESGCGKTTLARIVMGLVEPNEGHVLFRGREPLRDPRRRAEFRRAVRMVFQDPFSSLDPRFTVRRILDEALCLEGKAAVPVKKERMVECLRSVGLSGDMLERLPHEFSGGERQRIAIARALMTRPELLILDEAVSALDIIVQKKILALLIDLKKKMPITYFFISHDLKAVRKISQKIAVMARGKIVEYGPTADIFRSPLHPYTQQLLKAAVEYAAPDREPQIRLTGKLVEHGHEHFVLTAGDS